MGQLGTIHRHWVLLVKPRCANIPTKGMMRGKHIEYYICCFYQYYPFKYTTRVVIFIYCGRSTSGAPLPVISFTVQVSVQIVIGSRNYAHCVVACSSKWSKQKHCSGPFIAATQYHRCGPLLHERQMDYNDNSKYTNQNMATNRST